ncbi:MAG TPA: hypothetical protein VNU97_18900 [Rhizomicrobium sp.]|nr:hypothetical protein [Rhizomicrobium sp.]
MKKEAILSLCVMALMAGAVCDAQQPLAEPKPVSATTDDGKKKPDARSAPSDVQTPSEEVIVSIAGLYGDWRMELPEWPGSDKPVIGDFCSFKKRDDGVSITCADDFLQEIPEVTLDGDKLRMRWGGAFTHTIYDAIWEGNGTFDGEIVQASMGLVSHRFKAKMERASEPPAKDAPQASLAVLNNYFDDLASRSIREKYYEDDVYKAMKKAAAKRAYPHAGFAMKYFGKILEEKAGHAPTFPDVFKVSNAENAEQWCLVRIDAEGLADVRCREIL